MKHALILAASCAPLVWGAQAYSADTDPELAFNNHCRECHSAAKGDNRLGPTLYAVVGRKAGSVPDFGYSDALKQSGMVWTPALLDQWITNPGNLIPNNNMAPPFGGVADPAERAQIIKYLQSDAPAPKP